MSQAQIKPPEELSITSVEFIYGATQVGLDLVENHFDDANYVKAIRQLFLDIREELVRADTVGGPCYKCKKENLNDPSGYEECLLTCS